MQLAQPTICMAAPFRIREYEPTDRTRVLELNEAALKPLALFDDSGTNFEELDFADLHDIPGTYLEPGGTFLIGERDGELVAMGGFYPVANDVVKLRRMRVKPTCQGEGLGERLLAALEAEATRRGFTTVTLDTTVEQTAARKFYRHNGYSRTHRGDFDGLESVFFQKQLDLGEQS